MVGHRKHMLLGLRLSCCYQDPDGKSLRECRAGVKIVEVAAWPLTGRGMGQLGLAARLCGVKACSTAETILFTLLLQMPQHLWKCTLCRAATMRFGRSCKGVNDRM